MKMTFLGTLVALLAVNGGASASTYTVGDQLGWISPHSGKVAYRVWAAEQSFDFSDTVVFSWNGTHGVSEVSKADYDSCIKTNPIGTHCELGQKVTLSIGGASSIVSGAFSSIRVYFTI